MIVSKEHKKLAKNDIPKQKIQVLSELNQNFSTRQLLKELFHNASDFRMNIL